MYLNGMPPIDLQCHSTLHRALNFALNCECIARAHTPKYRSHSALSPSSAAERSEEHTSELQSPDHLVCRLLLEKKKIHLLTSQHSGRIIQHQYPRISPD